jgi:hypothetical protein
LNASVLARNPQKVRRKRAALGWTAEVADPGGLIVIIDRVKVNEPLFCEGGVWVA